MKTNESLEHETFKTEILGEYAYSAIQKHFKKSTKYETELTKSDPEPLHQMRVGMRRLRTALQVFNAVLVLPKAASDEHIKKIANTLGAARDLDVLKIALEEQYRPQLKGRERKILDQVLDRLEKRRIAQFEVVQALLCSSRYRKFKESFKDWLDRPAYGAIAPLPLLQVLPDLLLPLISQFLLHPGWLVNTIVELGEVSLIDRLGTEEFHQVLNQNADTLHDLRKQAKRVRYQTEFFTHCYDPVYAMRVKEFEVTQELLGHLQDSAVLNEFLRHELDSDWQKDLPTLTKQVEENQARAWADWQPIQRQYLDAEFREQLRQLVATPLKSHRLQAQV